MSGECIQILVSPFAEASTACKRIFVSTSPSSLFLTLCTHSRMLPLHLFHFIGHARWLSLQSTRQVFLCFDIRKRHLHCDLGDVNGRSNSVMYLNRLPLLLQTCCFRSKMKRISSLSLLIFFTYATFKLICKMRTGFIHSGSSRYCTSATASMIETRILSP